MFGRYFPTNDSAKKVKFILKRSVQLQKPTLDCSSRSKNDNNNVMLSSVEHNCPFQNHANMVCALCKPRNQTCNLQSWKGLKQSIWIAYAFRVSIHGKTAW